MAAISCDSVVAIDIVRMPTQAIMLTMIIMRKSINGFPFLSYISMGLVALWANRATLKTSLVHKEQNS